ncbi:tetratricopeptide repeat protein [Nisaea nitritireducens]|uniref:tetratricopeptide repeat protein n=1 Tax=Nisaea nitritireducens TaxID=568392 RepID=UPI0018687E61|nr:tetratricopeptide repeat protein [Nisaea nitritireducens]
MTPAAGTVNQENGNLERLFTEAIAQHEAGRLDEARPIYERLLTSVGPNPDILHLLGTLEFQQGAATKGARLIRLAILQRPEAASYHDHFGSAVRSTGDLARAEEAYGHACIINPASGSAFLNSAIVALETGRPDKAVERAGQAVRLMPGNAEAWLRFGSALYTTNKYEMALEAFGQARKMAPDSVEPYFHLQRTHTALKDTAAADKVAKQGMLLDPGRHEFYAHFRGGDIQQATSWKGLFPKRLATIVKPSSSKVWEQLAAEFYSELKYASVARAAQRGAVLTPELIGPYNSLATATYHLGQFESSIRISRYGLNVSPKFGDIGFNLSLSAFSIGDIETGWKYWPSRLSMAKAAKRFHLPMHWTPNEDEPGHLLVASEQGIGDDIIHLSCLPDLLDEVEQVTVETDARLFPLLKRSFPKLNLIEKQLQPSPNGETTHNYQNAQSEHRFTHSLISGDLPALYRHGSLKSEPRNGYLKADGMMQSEWQKRLRECGPAPYLGLCWRSGTLITDHRKIAYLTLEELIAEIPTERFTLINLQYGDPSDEIRELQEKTGITVHDFPDLNQTKELDRVAALMSCLDLAVSPGTAALALACSVGIPVIGLQKSYLFVGDGRDILFPNLYPVKPRSAPTIVPDRAQRMGEAIRYFLQHGKLPIRKP